MNRCSASSSTSELCQDCAYHASAVAAAGLATELHPAARGAHRRRRRAPRQRAGVGRAVEPHGRHPRAVRPLRGCCNRGGARAAPRAAGEQCHDRRQPVSCFRVIFTRCSSTLGDYFCWSSLVRSALLATPKAGVTRPQEVAQICTGLLVGIAICDNCMHVVPCSKSWLQAEF